MLTNKFNNILNGLLRCLFNQFNNQKISKFKCNTMVGCNKCGTTIFYTNKQF